MPGLILLLNQVEDGAKNVLHAASPAHGDAQSDMTGRGGQKEKGRAFHTPLLESGLIRAWPAGSVLPAVDERQGLGAGNRSFAENTANDRSDRL